MIEIVLLGKPVAKGRPRFNRETGRAYTPEKTVKYETMLRYAAEQVMAGRPPLEGPLELDMLIVAPVPVSWAKKKQEAALAGEIKPTGKPDLDNFMKVVDSCNLVVWIDDSQVCVATLRKKYGTKPGLWLRVWPITNHDNEGIFD